MKKKYIFYLFLFLYPLVSISQWKQNDSFTEKLLFSQTKQLAQFISRFNNEEDKRGEKYDRNSPIYRQNNWMRRQYIYNLFAKENIDISKDMKDEFVNYINSSNNVYLDFHGGEWVAEANAVFLYNNKSEVKITLILKLQEEKIGSNWVLKNIYFEDFDNFFFHKNEPQINKFIHPLSHELEFMNLGRFLNDNYRSAEYYAHRKYKTDLLTLFLYEVKKGNLYFKYVKELKFHFFQIENWYFEVSYFNRLTYNSGWLISDLKKIDLYEKFNFMKKICHENF